MHDSTTSGTTHISRPDPDHISTIVFPTGAKTHIYTDIEEVGVEKMKITGHSVVQNKAKDRDPALSYGKLPPWGRR